MNLKNKNRSLNRHHAARISIKTNNIKKYLQGSGRRKGRLRKAELHCKGKCWLCKPHKCKKFPRINESDIYRNEMI